MSFIRVMLLLVTFVAALPVSSEVVPEATLTGVDGRDRDTNEVVWTIEHRSTGLSIKGEPAFPILGPVQVGGKTLYAIRADLMTLDPELGVVVTRQQYPAMITKLEVEDGALVVSLEGGHGMEPVRIPYQEHSVPGRGPWTKYFLGGLRARADVPDALTDDAEFAKHEGSWAREREFLEAASRRDPTNPLLLGYAGLAAHLDKDDKTARQLFERAIEVDAPWVERVQLCGVLERAGEVQLASLACQAARARMIGQGVRPEALTNLVLFVIATHDLNVAMKGAIGREDFEGVDRIAGTMNDLFPNVEAGFVAWQMLGQWFDDHGQPELARKWRDRGDEVATAPMTRAYWGRARAVDMWILWLMAVFCALPIAGFALGLRKDDRPEGTRPWLPRFPIPHVVVAGGLLVGSIGLSWSAIEDIQTIGTLAAAPLGVFQEGYGSPDSIEWLEKLAPSPARDTLLDYANAELAAAQGGRPLSMTPPSPMLVFDAVTTTSKAEASDAVFSPVLLADGGGGTAFPNALPMSLPMLFVFMLFAVAGRAVRRTTPELADKVSIVVPGSAAGPLAAPLITALIGGGLYLLTPFGTLLQKIAFPSFGGYFGLKGVDTVDALATMYPMDRIWPWVAIGSAVVIHVATVVVLRKR